MSNYLTDRNITNKIIEACANGNIDALQIAFKAAEKNKYLDRGAETYTRAACVNNHVNIITWFIDNNYQIYHTSVIYSACQYNCIEIIDTIVEVANNANNVNNNFFKTCSWGGACKGGNFDVLIYLDNKGIRPQIDVLRIDTFFNIFHDIGCGGNSKILTKVLNCVEGYSLINGFDTFRSNNEMRIIYDQIFRGACSTNNKHMIKLAINRGFNNWNFGLEYACHSNNMEVVQLMVQHGANNWNQGMMSACSSDSYDSSNSKCLEIIKYMVECGANQFNDGLLRACGSGNIEASKLMIQYGANDWDRGLLKCCQWGTIDKPSSIYLIKLFINKGGTFLKFLVNVNEFSLACYYCSRYAKEDPSNDTKCNKLLVTYPVYVLLCCKACADQKIETCCIKKLPLELFRLLHAYL